MTMRSRSERAKLAYTLKSPQTKEFFQGLGCQARKPEHEAVLRHSQE
jgi:hypothetical protein